MKPKKIYLITNKKNQGISIAANLAMNLILEKINPDVVMKIDPDCLFLTTDWLKTMVNTWKRNRRIALSTYIQGLKDSPGGYPREHYGNIGGELLGMTRHIGGICYFVDASVFKDGYRWDESQPFHWMDDWALSQHLLKKGFALGYLENYYAEHYEGTSGQYERYPEYFERRKTEKTTRPDRSYDEIQDAESAYSTGTVWGDRVKDSIDKYKQYFEGSILDVGCNDGLGVEYMMSLGYDAQGIDASKNKVARAQAKQLPVIHGYMEELPQQDVGTVFCSHALEHAKDIHKAVSEIQRVANRAVLIFPVEEKTDNPGHTSPIPSIQYVKDLFPNSTVLHEEELNRMEREGVLILQFHK